MNEEWPARAVAAAQGRPRWVAVGNARRAQASHATRSTWSSALKIDATITQLHQPAAHHQHLVGAASQSVRSRALHAPARAWSAASTAHPKARARSPESSKKRLGPKTTHNTGPLSDKTLRVPPKLIQERQLIQALSQTHARLARCFVVRADGGLSWQARHSCSSHDHEPARRMRRLPQG